MDIYTKYDTDTWTLIECKYMCCRCVVSEWPESDTRQTTIWRITVTLEKTNTIIKNAIWTLISLIRFSHSVWFLTESNFFLKYECSVCVSPWWPYWASHRIVLSFLLRCFFQGFTDLLSSNWYVPRFVYVRISMMPSL